MYKSSAFILCLSLAMGSLHIEALTLTGRLTSVVATTLAAFGGSYYVESKESGCPWERDTNGKLTNYEEIKRAALPTAGAFLLSVFVTSCYSPEYRYTWAEEKRNKLKRRILFNYPVTDRNLNDISVASGAESHGLPLVTMFLDLADMDKTISNMISELDTALCDINESSGLSLKISDLLDQLHADRLRIRQSEYAVKNTDPQAWQEQWRTYNENRMKQKEIDAKLAAASQPHMHYNYHF